MLAVTGDQSELSRSGGESELVPLDSLVAVARSGDPIYPGFKRLGSVERGGDKPHHVVIKGENYHALEALKFSHAGKVDCIYIDPPYNSGATAWKYNNDYVDREDAYSHSKWLSMMEHRLRLAKELLDPDHSVLIVTIDECEYLRLGLLLEQVFPEVKPTKEDPGRRCAIQMISSVINRKGSQRQAEFDRTDEYLFFVMLGHAMPDRLRLGDEWLSSEYQSTDKFRWPSLLKSGQGSRRVDYPNLFYPIFIRNGAEGPEIASIGEPLPQDAPRKEPPTGTDAIWPLKKDGTEARWYLSASELTRRWKQGYVRLGKWNDENTTVQYLSTGQIRDIENGIVPLLDKTTACGAIVVDDEQFQRRSDPGTAWNVTSHSATESGTQLLKQFAPFAEFPFPKSLYAVEDALRFFLVNRPEAVVMDFFAGSGTTAHAVMRLNHEDGGARQSILITNNEVSAAEAKSMSERGLFPGDAQWEALGIFEHVTRPRIEAAVTGRTPDGEPVKGDYKFNDEFPMADGLEENVEFLELKYLDAIDVELGLAFQQIAPLLWLRAGGTGRMISERCWENGEPKHFEIADRYGVLFDTDHWRLFLDRLPETAATVFIATDSPSVFASIAGELAGRDVVRLYGSYLSAFGSRRSRKG